MMETEKTWWLAGDILGALYLLRDPTSSDMVREHAQQLLLDRTEHWAYDDNECRRVEK